MAENRRTWLGRLGLALGSTVAALVVAEITLRLLGIAPARYAHPRHLETADKRHSLDAYPDNPRGYFPLDLRNRATRARLSALGFAHLDRIAKRTPYAVEGVYTRGLCRERAIPPREPGKRRILLVGDSFTEGQGVRQKDTFGAVLARDLPRTQVINCGRRGYDFPALRTWTLRHLDTDPDVVVYAMVLNDPERSPAFNAKQKYIDDWIVARRVMVSEGDGSPPPFVPRIFSMIEDRLESARVGAATTRWYEQMVGPENRDGWRATVDDIAALDRAARDRGAQFVVVLWPLLIDLDGHYPFTAVHRTIGRALTARGIPFRDALPAFIGKDPERLWVHPTDRHPNAIAQAIFAHVVEDALRSMDGRAKAGGGR